MQKGVGEIHLFDADTFLSHNAFRSPGAPSIAALRDQPLKVAYLNNVYSNMHQHVIPHGYHITDSTLAELTGMNFVFICIDDCEIKRSIIQNLMKDNIPFVDTGMGVYAVDGHLTGSLRATTATKIKRDHVYQRIAFSDKGDDEYNTNIQIAEMNALNAALAVIKWKKLFGFYHDMENEHNSVFNINNNQLVNEDGIIT